MLEGLKSVASCGHDWAEKKAQVVIELDEQYRLGNIDKDEYKELLEDIIRTDELDDASYDMEVKGMLIAGVSGILSAL